MGLLTDLVSYWKLEDDTDNTDVVDSHGSNTGTANKDTEDLSTKGKIGKGFGLDGSADKVDVGSPADLNFGQDDFSVSAWVKAPPGQGRAGIVEKRAGAGVGWRLHFATDGKVAAHTWDGASNPIATSGDVLQDNKWHHCVGVYQIVDSKWRVQLYVDGELEDTTNGTSQNSLASTAPVQFGVDDSTHFLEGVIDEFGVWARPLESGEITTLYNEGRGLTHPFVVGTKPATDTTKTSARLHGELVGMEGEAEITCYFQYREKDAEAWIKTADQTLSDPADFQQDISGLTAETVYEFRAVGQWGEEGSEEYAYGGILFFPAFSWVVFTESPPDNEWAIPEGVTEVEVLVVAGGGGGGSRAVSGGGGGAGGVLYEATHDVSEKETVTVIVGAGGAGGGSGAAERGTSGGNSQFDTTEATGGGGGGGNADGLRDGLNGGSGGGGAGGNAGDDGSGGDGTSSQGNDGGDGLGHGTISVRAGGGGGGASLPGTNAAASNGGNGGAGADYTTEFTDFYGEEGFFAGGGGGGNSTSKGSGGVGGGADAGEDAIDGTGGGGGGATTTSHTPGGNGGSGIVIVKYDPDVPPPPPPVTAFNRRALVSASFQWYLGKFK